MIKIIPAIDIIDGQCVRLSQGDYQRKKVYNTNPLEVAKSFEDAGIEQLHLVDLDGAKAKHIVNWKVLETIANNTSLKIDFGGGIKTDEDIKTAFKAGAHQVTCGSIAAKNPRKVLDWLAEYGNERIILGADAKDKLIAVSGWMEETGIALEKFISEYIKKGLRYVICTDIAVDGTLAGPNINLYKELINTFPEMMLIASGGVSQFDDIVALDKAGIYGVIVGKAIYEGKIDLKQIASLH